MKKKLFIALAMIVTISVFACGCSLRVRVTESKYYVGIVSAMDNEIALLLNEVELDRVDTIAGVQYHIGTLHGVPVIITRAGIGKIRSSSCATAMFSKYPISKVIFTGIAGCVADGPEVLDEVIATRVVEHDYGIFTNEGFEWRSGDPGYGNQPGEYYYCDPELVEIAYNASEEVIGAEHTFKGTIATGDQFIASEEYVKRLRDEYDAYACEMEGAAVAVVCMRYEIPFVVIRCLSDMADGNAHESYANFGDVAAANSCRIVHNMLVAMGNKQEH